MTSDGSQTASPDPVDLSRALARIAERSQRLVQQFVERQSGGAADPAMAAPLNIANAFIELGQAMMADPAALAQAQAAFWRDQSQLWRNTAASMMGEPAEAPVAAPSAADRRFRHEDWQKSAIFDHVKQSYLLSARWLHAQVAGAEGLDPKTARKVEFYTRQFIDAMSPTNFALTNPEVLRATADSGGMNLVRGLEHLLEDMERGGGRPAIRMTDPDAFEVGGNIANTPGKIVFQNELMQLIQYAPRTETVLRRPLLIVPPWINKFYILDLRPKNSFIRWAVGQGHTVFVISWVNPDADLARKSFADYMHEGPLAALSAIEQATGEREVNLIGYCIGGTLSASTLAYMAAHEDDRVKSATYFTTMVDFEEAGDLGVFIDDEQLDALDQRMERDGVLDGAAMATTFNMLRANDLIWSFVINNYLLGKEPAPFDLLYWNADSTRMPAAMHSFYLRRMYQENRLVEPGGITLDGVSIDLRRITVPSFILATRDDHIAPWASTYRAVGLYGGPVRFCLAGSGHIAGVINPPADKPKYGYFTNSRKPKAPEKWLEGAVWHDGSWWPAWQAWIARHGGGRVPARTPGDGALAAIEDAPGSYVKVRSDG